MKVALYSRVSTIHQVDKDSLPMQRKDLTAYAELVLGCTDYDVYEDAGYSGKNTDRPAFQEMMERIRAGEYTHLLVWKIDRISRNLLDFAQMYAELKRLHVVFISRNEQFDTSTAMGEAMLKIILVFAELERQMTSERVSATMISRATQGRWNGGRIPYGYDYDADTDTFTVREDEAEACRLLRDTYLSSKSLLFTARTLNAKGYTTRAGVQWSAQAVWIIAQSPFYYGAYRYNKYKGADRREVNKPEDWVTVENHHPAIFTREEHERMTALRKTNGRSMREVGQYHIPKNVHVFGRLCYCGYCGALMTATIARPRKSGYRPTVFTCPRRRHEDCPNQSVADAAIGQFVFNFIINMMNCKTNENLSNCLLAGAYFHDVDFIHPEGLEQFSAILGNSRAKSKVISSPPKINPELNLLLKEKAKQERALTRLQNMYLYSGISDVDFMVKKKEIQGKLSEIGTKLGLTAADKSLSDAEFIRLASHLIIAEKLKAPEVDYEKLATQVSLEVLKEYINQIVDKIILKDGHVTSITFRNGLTMAFEYQKSSP